MFGWWPSEVRAMSLADFIVAVNGQRRMREGGGSLDAEDVREIKAMLEG